MKKRILSLLLLLAMLVTMIPVASVAAEEAVSVEEQDYDYHDLYVQAGLTGLFTAIDKDDETVSLTSGAGTWTNRVTGGLAATLSGINWKLGANGGVGFPVYAGQVLSDGTYQMASDYNTIAYHKDVMGAAANYRDNNKLDFTNALLPQEDYTIEILAKYNHIEAVYGYDDAENGIVKGTSAGDFKQYFKTNPWTNHAFVQMVDAIGFITSWTNHLDDEFGGSSSVVKGRGGVRWMLYERATRGAWSSHSTKMIGGSANSLCNPEDGAWRKYDTIHNYTIQRDEERNAETNVLSATYSLLRDRVTYQSATVSTADTETGKVYYDKTEEGNFYLSASLPTEFFSVRIYTAVLSDAEKAQNHAVDILEYYNLAIDKAKATEKMAELSEMFASVGFEQDAAAKAAKAIELQTAIDQLGKEPGESGEGVCPDPYVSDGLVAFFSAQSEYADTVDLEKGTWTDFFRGKVATLRGSTWKLTENGFLGFNIYRGQADDAAGKNYVDDVATNNYKTPATRLELGIALLPKGDFTVDYTATYKPIYTLKTGTTDEIVGEAFDYNGANWEEQYYNKLPAVEAYGYLTGWTICRDALTKNDQGAVASARGGVRWVIAGGAVAGKDAMTLNHGMNLLADTSYRSRGVAHSYTVTRDETEATAVYQIIQDTAVLKTSTKFGDGIDFTEDDNGSFYLSDRLPTDFYALRIYDRVLSAEELQMNRLGDFISFYRITLPDNIREDRTKLTALATASSAIPMSNDAVEAAGAVLTFNEIIAKLSVDTGIYDLYVQDGLVANYTALNTTDTTVFLESGSGSWINRVDGRATATFITPASWKKNANGSVGFTLYRGMIDENGNYTDESPYNNYKVGTRLKFADTILPTGDFTVEYVAEYKHLYAVDVDGNPVRETFETDNNGLEWGEQFYSMSAVDQLGYMAGFTGLRDGYNDKGSMRGYMWWLFHSESNFNNNSPTDDEGNRYYFTEMKPVEGDTVFHKQGGVFTFAITRDVNLDLDNDKNEATYSLLHDNALLRSTTVAKVAYTTKDGKATYNVDFSGVEPKAFHLSDRVPTDFYAVRVYDRTLTYEEHLLNHFVDIAIYYELELGEAIFTDETLRARCIYAFANTEIATDGVQKAANKKAYQKLYDDIGAGTAGVAYNYDELFVQDGLVALYSAFEGDTSISTFNGTWANKAPNSAYGAAIIRNPSAWERKTVGYGYSMTYDKWLGIAKNTGISLPAELEDLDNFTVETFATVEGITNEDGSRFVNTFAKDENGNNYTDEKGNWVRTGMEGGDYIGETANFRFGLLTNLFYTSLYYPAGGASLAGRWYLYNQGYPTGSVPKETESVVLQKMITADDSATENVDETTYTNVDAGWRLMGSESIPTAGAMHVVKETGASTVSYAISYNCSEDPTQSASVSIGKYETLMMVEQTDKHGAGRFSLFNAIPTTVYAIRVYDRVLTAAEKLQNNFIDKAGFYSLNLDAYKALSAEDQAKVHLGFANVGTDLTREEVDSILNFYMSNDADSVNEMVNALVTFSEYLPITAGAYGYRALFTPSISVQNLFKANGYKVFYGAIVAPGGKHNAVEDLTVSYADGKLIANNGTLVEVEGEGLTPTFYNYVGSGDAALRYSAAVTASDAKYFGVDMLVRGYAVVVAPDGTVTAAYDVNEQTNGSLSILEAADYFVNAYTGPVDTMYKYMNSAALRHVLAASGVAARVDLTADLVLYVDAENGSDENSGLLQGEAYATIAKAFDAAKAHLAKAGRKGVTIQLADGTYRIDKALVLSAEDVKADSYYLNIVGNGEGTVLTSVVEINRDDAWEDDDSVYVVQLPGVTVAGKTIYPDLRALYGDGELLDIAHFGDDEDTYFALGAYVIDAQGNVLPKDPAKEEQWQVTAADAKKASQIVFELPIEMFEDGYSAEDYAGTELHWMSTMRMLIMPIDHIVYQDDYVEAFVDCKYFMDVSSFDYNIAGSDCFLENSKGTLISNGDTYYYDSANGVLYFHEDEKFFDEFESFGYASAENAFIFDGLKNVTVSNMTITGLDSKYLKDGVGMYLGQSAMATLTEANGTVTNGTGDGFAMTPAGILGQDMTDLVVNNVVFRDTLGAGVVLKGISKNVYIDSNVFMNLGDTAIRVGFGYIYQGSYVIGGEITNNLITNIGNLYNTASGITVFTAADLLVTGNTIAQVPYTGVSLGWAWSPQPFSAESVKKNAASFNLYNVEVAYNYITDYLMSQRDGGAIYTLGGYDLSMMGTQPVNFMHHNYVNLSEETGCLGDDYWSVMGYYHDFGVTNWSNYENVLVNTLDLKGGGIYPAYLQNWTTEENKQTVDSAHTFVDNYFIGYDTPKEVYGAKGEKTFSEQYYNVANDYICASVEDLANNTSIGAVAYGETCLTKESSATAANDVAAIFAAAGSTLGTEYKDSGLYWTADAAEKLLVLDDTRKISGDLPVYKITFTDGEVTTHTFALEGALLTVPTLFINDYAEITYTVDGEVINPAEYYVPANDVTVDVTMTVPSHNVTFTDGIDTETVSVAEGSKLEVPAKFLKEGYRLTFTMEGALFELQEFVMGENDVEISIRYEKLNFRVTFQNAHGDTVSVVAAYDTKISAPASLKKDGYTTKYTIDGKAIDLLTFTMPANNVTVDVDYQAISYLVSFFLPASDKEFAAVKTPYQTAINLPDIAIGDYVDVLEDDEYRYKFNGWIGYTEGDTLEVTGDRKQYYEMDVIAEKKFTVSFLLPDGSVYDTAKIASGALVTVPELAVGDYVDVLETETHKYKFNGWKGYTDGMTVTEDVSFMMEVIEEEKATEPEFIWGDIDGNGVVEGIDITLVTQIASGTLDINAVVGNPDLDGNGVVEGIDITLVTQIASGVLS